MFTRISLVISLCLAPLVSTYAKTAPSGFGAFSPITESLAKDPSRSRELDFINACRGRLLRLEERGESTQALLDRFDKNFDSEKISPETRLCLILLIANRAEAMTPSDLRRAKRLAQGLNFKTPELQALSLYAMASIARYDAVTREKDYLIKDKLSDLLKKNIDAPWLRGNPKLEELLYEPFASKPNYFLTTEQNRKSMRGFIDFLEGISVEKRTYAMNLTLGMNFIYEAWQERGTDFAYKTTGKQFEGFEQYLRRATPCLKMANKMKPSETAPLIGLMIIAQTGSDPTAGSVDRWMSLARQVAPEDPKIYHCYGAAKMLRWGGSEKDMIDCYELLRSSKNYDSYKPGTAFGVMRMLMRDLEGEELKRMQKKLAEEFIPVANNYIRRFNETGTPLVAPDGGLYDFRAMALGALVDADLIKKINTVLPYSRPGFPEDSDASVNPYVIYQCIHPFGQALACAEAGDSSLIEEGQASYRTKKTHGDTRPIPQELVPRGDWDLLPLANEIWQADDAADFLKHSNPRWLEDYGKRLAKMADHVKSKPAKDFMHSMIELIRLESEFQQGKEVIIPLHSDLWTHAIPSQYPWNGNFNGEMAYEDAILCKDLYHYATINAFFMPPYEITLRINAVEPLLWPDVGVSVGRCITGNTGRSFLLNTISGKVAIVPPETGFPGAKEYPYKGKIGRLNTLKIRIFPHGYGVALNDGKWNEMRDDKFIPHSISIGSSPRSVCFGRFEYGPLTIRKISAEECSPEEKSWMRKQASQGGGPTLRSNAPAQSGKR